MEQNSILNAAREAVYNIRQDLHVKQYSDYDRVAAMWSAITGSNVKPEHVPLCLIAMSMIGETNEHDDNNLVEVAKHAESLHLYYSY